MRPCVIFNPTARGDKARRFLAHLQQCCRDATLKPTTGAGGARGLAAEAVREGFDTLIAAGGDGTVHEVLNGIGEADGFGQVRLAVIPVGGMNVFARELGIPFSVQGAWETVARGREITIDLPVSEYMAAGKPARRYFAQLGGAGWDARAIQLVNWEQKKRSVYLAYILAGLRALSAPRPLITIRSGKGEAEGEWILFGNGRFYAGSYPLFPKARLRDGELDVCVIPKITWASLCRQGCGYLARKPLGSGREIHFQTEQFTLTSRGSTPFELDGEWVGELPVTISLHPGGLRILAPKPV